MCHGCGTMLSNWPFSIQCCTWNQLEIKSIKVWSNFASIWSTKIECNVNVSTILRQLFSTWNSNHALEVTIPSCKMKSRFNHILRWAFMQICIVCFVLLMFFWGVKERLWGQILLEIAFRNCFTLEKLQWLGTAVYGCSKMGDGALAQFGPGNQLNAGCVL